MKNILVLCAKSSSGKDAAYDYIKEKYDVNETISLTTRPMRDGEEEGITYTYLNNKEFEDKIKSGLIIEHRAYNVDFEGKKDIWYYGTSSEAISKDKNNIVILDIDGLNSLIKIFGKDNITSILLSVDDDIREERAKARGSFDQVEWDRRILDDNIKFSEERIKVCDYTINNNGSIEDFLNKVDKIITTL